MTYYGNEKKVAPRFAEKTCLEPNGVKENSFGSVALSKFTRKVNEVTVDIP